MVQVLIINNRYDPVDTILEAIISRDVQSRIEKIRENNFTIDRIEIVLSFYSTPIVNVYVQDIIDRSLFYHRQNVRLGFHIMHPIIGTFFFYQFIIEETIHQSEIIEE